eukprot:4362436-Amphidinium_carterae.1
MMHTRSFKVLAAERGGLRTWAALLHSDIHPVETASTCSAATVVQGERLLVCSRIRENPNA